MQTGFKEFVKQLIHRFSQANINDSAAVLSYYMLLAIFPIMLIAGNLISFLHFDTNGVLRYIEPVLPDAVYQTLAPIIRSFLEQGSTGTLSLGIIVTIWSAGRAVSAFQRSINLAYGIEQPNAIISRFFSFILIILVIISIIAIAVLFSLSEWLGRYLKPWLNISNQFTDFIGSLRWPISFLIIFLLSGLLYMVVPSAKVKFRYVWIGAFVTTVGWLVLAQGFSIYIRYFTRNITGYQTLGTFIILLIWMNISGFILLAGGVINATVQEWRQGEIEELDIMQNIVNQAKVTHQKRQTKRRSASAGKKKRPSSKKH
ncbi:YihY/virulence factor BrkB family protein [Lactobacillus sp. LC28-10]|uniref:YihY/virulence factor BrkB family protein n=1 Tax=Secundilactobacillus angelensis TaxID=2722706 RepID=A0ABX1KWH0_9LACO|nr:YihY/virulence factor BrkB family protein [Secundilactobacillus angelensis]MCH5462553.1 YihY/virulence factor BrkB family protein [Secundilactobacillus angelensis]NLR18256.1 YihY/virulence factor BrkB family protein [Secundilactobacillus angelensis]